MTQLETMPLDELKALRKEVDRAIRSFEARRKKAALEAAESAARELGFSLSELTGMKASRSSSSAKYRHPQNSEITWTGRGRQPGWIKEGLASGKSLDDFEIG